MEIVGPTEYDGHEMVSVWVFDHEVVLGGRGSLDSITDTISNREGLSWVVNQGTTLEVERDSARRAMVYTFLQKRG